MPRTLSTITPISHTAPKSTRSEGSTVSVSKDPMPDSLISSRCLRG